MEDILEEIVGDINDEFDDEEVFYSRLDDENFVFDGKTSLTDVIRIMDLEDEVFEKVRGEAESIGGLMIEMAGKIPASGEKMQYENFRFTVELSDKRRVRRVKVSKLNETAPVHS
jgi:CBS domain containing-hemolysin-like protein